MNPNLKKLIIILSVIIDIILLDQLSKYLVITFLEDIHPPKVELLPIFDLVLVKNYGISFGIFNSLGNPQLPLILVTLAVIAVLATWLKKEDGLLDTIYLSMIIGGAFGNLIDRVFRGAVIDFLNFHYMDCHYPSFNLADSCIVIGVIVVMVNSFRTTNKT